MRRIRFALLFACAALVVAQSQNAPQQQPSPEQQRPSQPVPPAQHAPPVPQQAAPAKPVPTPELRSFDISAMDKSADPCTDFYQYACGAWMAKNPIPGDQPSWGRFNELAERNRDVLHDILERASKPDAKRTPVLRLIGDYYAACMDESTVNKLGTKPLEPELARIAAIRNRRQFIETVARLQQSGVNALFRFGPSPDLHNASMNIAAVDQGGLGLPDRDYYLKNDAKSVETRAKYVEHMQKMFELLGHAPAKAAAEAKTVMNIETALAKASMDRVARRNPSNRDHPMSREELARVAPQFDFNAFFGATGAPAFSKLNVVNPDFFKQVSPQIEAVPLDSWKTYLTWHLVHEVAPALSQPFVAENFRFFQQYLNGQKEQQVRWKRCVRLTDQQLGEALGQPYVDETFGAEGKRRTLEMVHAIEQAMAADLKALSWMTDETKKQAEIKLKAIQNKIGYPDKWRDYSTLKVSRNDFLGNVTRAEAFEFNRETRKIGKPVDKQEWNMSPPTVNAYYSPLQNNINFPAGILQPPFYDNRADDAVNFGGIGAVVGHELTHGFDDQGSRFDAEGNLRNWWSDTDRKEFDKRTGCIADEYSSFVAVDDVRLNGRLTLGENTADNGGVRLAFMALKQHGKDLVPKNGFTPEQRFFISYAQIWCQNVTPENARLRALTDPHSPGRYRVNGVLQNMPEFWETFGCKQGQPMVRENACRVW